MRLWQGSASPDFGVSQNDGAWSILYSLGGPILVGRPPDPVQPWQLQMRRTAAAPQLACSWPQPSKKEAINFGILLFWISVLPCLGLAGPAAAVGGEHSPFPACASSADALINVCALPGSSGVGGSVGRDQQGVLEIFQSGLFSISSLAVLQLS